MSSSKASLGVQFPLVLRSKTRLKTLRRKFVTFLPSAVLYYLLTFVLQIEVNLSVLWEDANESPAQVAARAEMLTMAADILKQIDLWSQADKLRATIKASSD